MTTTITERSATDHERRRQYEHLSWFEFRRRKLARREALKGEVRVISFPVRRAWRLFSCSDEGCCPRHWFLETDDNNFVEISSWHGLVPTVDWAFPGDRAKVTIWPVTNRILDIAVSGAPVPASELSPEVWAALPSLYNEVSLRSAETLPVELQQAIDSQ